MPEFASKWAGLSQGLQSGMNMGLQIDQARRQRRQQEWEQDYKMAGLALDVASKDSLHFKNRKNAFNNGFLPVWNKYNDKNKMEPLTEADEGDPALMDAWGQTKKITSDKKLDPTMRMEGLVSVWGDYRAKRGQADEVQKLSLDLMKDKVDSSRQRKGDGAGGGSDSPSKIKAEILRSYLSGGLDKLTPEQKAVVAEDLQDPAFKIALTAYGQNMMNMANKPEEQLAQLKEMTKTIRQALDEQARTGGTPAPAGAPVRVGGQPKAFATPQEAEAAGVAGKISPGETVVVNGEEFVWQ